MPPNACECKDMLTPMYIPGEEIAGVEPDGTVKAMEKMLKEGVVGEAGPMFVHETPVGAEMQPKEAPIGDPDFNDRNYWKSGYTQSVVEEEQL